MGKIPWAQMSERAKAGVNRRAERYSKTEKGKAAGIRKQARYRERHPERIAAALATERGQQVRRTANQKHLAKRRGIVPCLDFPPAPVDGRCQNCGKPATLHLDHNHETGKFRGYLCHHCNTGIGLLGDSVEGLEQALAYLSSSPE